MNALSKAIIADTLCNRLSLNKPDSKEIVESFFEEIRHALENGQHVKLSGFGNFILRDKSDVRVEIQKRAWLFQFQLVVS